MTTDKKVLTRAEVDQSLTWDLTPLAKNNEEYRQKLAQLKQQIANFVQTYKKAELSLTELTTALADFNDITENAETVMTYGSLLSSTDFKNAENSQLAFEGSQFYAHMSAELQFFQDYLLQLDEATFTKLSVVNPQFTGFLRSIENYKKIALDPKVEHALAVLSPTFSAPENTYEAMQTADLHFDDFTVDGKSYPLSFGLYEDYYAYHEDPKIRRAAFAAFSEELAHHQNVTAANYLNEVTTSKQLATLHGFDSVIDFLLQGQEVDRSMFNRQIDLIIEKFGPVMQKYLKLLQKERGLDELTFADRLIDLDPDFAPSVTIEESKKYIETALQPLGEDYVNMIMQAYPERWVDFVQNKGKSSGGFCTYAYNAHPYILMSWQDVMADVYTLIHEMGHAGQFILTAKKHPVLDFEPSTYIVEAPSTFNELLLTDSLVENAKDDRMKRYALTKMLNNTYFHNFITHLLEAAFQRDVYNLIDNGQNFDAAKLNEIKSNVFHKFFGDALTLNPGAELTWMRQSHYYMGLYSYTYSASLTVSTQAFLKIKEEGQPAVDRWLDFLSIGASKNPVDSAAALDVDITTDSPLLNTIDYLNSVVDEVIELTDKIEQDK